MNPLTLTIIRHGQTDWNKLGKLQGSSDIPLNEEGRNQAKDAKAKIDLINFDKCFSSDLARAFETARIVTNDKYNIVKTQILRELFLGDWETKTVDELRKENQNIDAYLIDPWNNPPTNGETIQQLFERASIFINQIKDFQKESSKHLNILVVSHSGTIRALLTALVCNNDSGINGFSLENCGISQVLFDSSGRTRLTKING